MQYIISIMPSKVKAYLQHLDKKREENCMETKRSPASVDWMGSGNNSFQQKPQPSATRKSIQRQGLKNNVSVHSFSKSIASSSQNTSSTNSATRSVSSAGELSFYSAVSSTKSVGQASLELESIATESTAKSSNLPTTAYRATTAACSNIPLAQVQANNITLTEGRSLHPPQSTEMVTYQSEHIISSGDQPGHNFQGGDNSLIALERMIAETSKRYERFIQTEQTSANTPFRAAPVPYFQHRHVNTPEVAESFQQQRNINGIPKHMESMTTNKNVESGTLWQQQDIGGSSKHMGSIPFNASFQNQYGVQKTCTQSIIAKQQAEIDNLRAQLELQLQLGIQNQNITPDQQDNFPSSRSAANAPVEHIEVCDDHLSVKSGLTFHINEIDGNASIGQCPPPKRRPEAEILTDLRPQRKVENGLQQRKCEDMISVRSKTDENIGVHEHTGNKENSATAKNILEEKLGQNSSEGWNLDSTENQEWVAF